MYKFIYLWLCCGDQAKLCVGVAHCCSCHCTAPWWPVEWPVTQAKLCVGVSCPVLLDPSQATGCTTAQAHWGMGHYGFLTNYTSNLVQSWVDHLTPWIRAQMFESLKINNDISKLLFHYISCQSKHDSNNPQFRVKTPPSILNPITWFLADICNILMR